MIDNDSAYRRKMRNRFWPAFYILGKKGRVHGMYYGETHAGNRRARKSTNWSQVTGRKGNEPDTQPARTDEYPALQ